MIPRRFFLLFDLIFLIIAFLGAYLLASALLPLFAVGGPLHLNWIDLLSPRLDKVLPPLTDMLWIFLAVAPMTLFFLGAIGNYSSLLTQSYTRIAVGALLSPLSGLSLLTLMVFALRIPAWSRLLIFVFIALSSLCLGIYRIIIRMYLLRRRAAGYYARNTLLIGTSAALTWMVHYMAETATAANIRLFGYLRLHAADGQAEPSPIAIPALGEVRELGDLLIHRPIHEVIAIHPVAGGEWIRQVIEDCDHMGVVLRIVPEALVLGERRTLRALYPFEPLHLPAVVLAPPHWDSDARFVKRFIDIIGSAALLVLLAPLFALIALAIRLTTPGMAVFYPWRVVGKNGVEFTGYKFTTMAPDADVVKTHLLAYNEMTGPVFKMKRDPRVTPLGRFLRKYSLNELPQIWSVLKGDMSLVGPRPAFRHELERYEFWQKRKLSVRPGITCLWQVRGRNKISNFDDWVKMDLEYIDNWSLWLDFKILIRTFWAVVGGTGS